VARQKIEKVLQDYLGRDVKADDPVVFFHRGLRTMKTGRIKKISKVNVTVEWAARNRDISRSVNTNDVVLIDETVYIFHCLKNGGS
jgi:hypothetical protein